MNYWLMKTEPQHFSIDDLKSSKNATTSWEGVRNYQARNFMRDEMKLDDKVLIYHSTCKDVGIVGIAKVVKESHPDQSALDIKSPYFDIKSTVSNPRWFMVQVMFVKKFDRIISLKSLKEDKNLTTLHVTKKGNRLSITPVTYKEYNYICSLRV